MDKIYMRMRLFLVLIIVFQSRLLFASEILFIHADIGNVRDKKNGKIIARLDINTKIEVLKQEDDWYLISFSENEKGWVNKVALGNVYLTEASIIDSIKINTNLSEKWAERLVHAYPQKNNWLLLLKVYKENNNTEGIKRVEKYLKGLSSVFLVKCNCGELQLMGEIDSSGLFHTKVFFAYDKSTTDSAHSELFFLKYQLERMKWYSLGGEFDIKKIGEPKVVGKDVGLYYSDYKFEDNSNVFYLSFGKCSDALILCTSRISRVNWHNDNNRIEDSCGILKALQKNLKNDFFYDTILKPCSLNIITELYKDVCLFEIEAKALTNSEGWPIGQWVTAVFNYKGERIYPADCLSEIFRPSYTYSRKFKFIDSPFFSIDKFQNNRAYNISKYGDSEQGTTNFYYHEDLIIIDKDGNFSSSEIVFIQGPG